MNERARVSKTANDAAFAPKLISMFREGYNAEMLRRDAIAGLTVAIVALPLSMAIAIASGAPPERGLYTAIIGGFLISVLSGSRYQIGGPTGTFIVITAAVIERHGLDGMLLATILAGVIMIALGAFRLGTLIRFIPQPVTIGFSAAIAVVYFVSQIKDLLGLSLAAKEPAALVPKLSMLVEAFGSINPSAVGVSSAAILLTIVLKRMRAQWPSMLITVTFASVVVAVLGLPVETIGSRFGGVPALLPPPALPTLSVAKLEAVLPYAFAIALLGSIESLLSAAIADGMTGRRHRSNTELVAQGVANIGVAFFGGISATGTIARTATNVRANAHGPVSGMLHSLYLLVFMVIAAPLLARVPLAALAAILAIVAWDMIEKHAIASLIRQRGADAAVFAATFLLTVFRDLTEGILVGVVLGAVLFAVRMARLVEVTSGASMLDTHAEAPLARGNDDVITYRISGPLFFGSTPRFGDVMAQIGVRPRVFLIDLTDVPLIDASGADALACFVDSEAKAGVRVLLVGARPDLRLMLDHHARFEHAPSLAAAQERVRAAV